MRASTILLLVLAAVPLVGCGGDDASSTPGGAAEPTWGWVRLDAGRDRARERGVPMLVLCQNTRGRCPPAERLAEMLHGHPTLDAICVRVRSLGGPTASEAEREFLARPGPRTVKPALLVVTPDLDVLHRQTSRLCPFYGRSYEELSTDPGPLLTVTEVEALVRDALVRRSVVDAQLEALRSRGTPAAHVERAEILLERGRVDLARAAANEAVAGPPPPAMGMRLHEVLRTLGMGAEADRLLEDLLDRHPGDPAAGWWRLAAWRRAVDGGRTVEPGEIERALAGAREHDARLAASLLALRVVQNSERPARSAAELASDLGALRALDLSIYAEADAEGASILDILGKAALARKDFEDAEQWMRRLFDRFPDSSEAQFLRHGHFQCVCDAKVTGRLEDLDRGR